MAILPDELRRCLARRDFGETGKDYAFDGVRTTVTVHGASATTRDDTLPR
jgi:hypothetical protein